MNIDSILNDLHNEELSFEGSVFAVPFVSGIPIRIQLNGLVMDVHIQGVRGRRSHIAICEGIEWGKARWIREADEDEKREFFASYNSGYRFTLVENVPNFGWLGIPQMADSRITWGLMQINIVPDNVQRFDSVICIRDGGGMFWFKEINRNADPQLAHNIRVQLAMDIIPETLEFPFITPETRFAYAKVREFEMSQRIQALTETVEQRLRDSIRHMGGTYISHIQRGDDTWVVTYSIVDGRGERREHVSTVSGDNFQVEKAGICLSRRDGIFDLASLISVLKIGYDRGVIYRV